VRGPPEREEGKRQRKMDGKGMRKSGDEGKCEER